VTVIFADIVSWTSLAATLTADASMRLLDKLFQRFDTLCSSHGVYKGASSLAARPALRWRI
jgi:class 3 adenylate cyclase